MFNVVIRTLKSRKLSLIIYTAGAALFMELFAALFPTFADKQAEFDKLIEIYPEELFQGLGINKADFTLSNIESYLAVEHFSMTWPIVLIIFVMSFGSSQIAEEIERGTIEVLLSQPISRLKLFFAKYIAGAINVIIFTVVSILIVIPLAEIHGVAYRVANLNAMVFLGLLFGFAVFSLSMFASSIFSEKSKANLLVGGALIVSYVANIVSSFIESLDKLKYLSVFYYFDFSKALNKAEVDILTIWVFLGITLVFAVLGALWFNRRDVAI